MPDDATTPPVSRPGAPATDASAALPVPAKPRVWVERTGTRTYVGRNARGAEVSIGPSSAGAVFSPGDLLKLALAGCSGMSADSALARRLGDDVAVTIDATGSYDPDEDLFESFAEHLVVDLSGLDAGERDRLLTVVQRAVDRHCTIRRTVEPGAPVTLQVVDAPADTAAALAEARG